MANKDKEKMAGYLGSGGARHAANTFINRHNVIDDMVSGSAGKKGAVKGKTGSGRKK